MQAVGLICLLSTLGASPPAATSTPSSAGGAAAGLEQVRLQRGEEHTFAGEVTECGDRIDNRFRKKYSLEVRLFVLETQLDYADCAVLTALRAEEDPVVAQAVASVSGTHAPRVKVAPTLRIDLIRVDIRGRVDRLLPPVEPPPLALGKAARTAPLPAVPLDHPPGMELGFFAPLPIDTARVGARWDSPEPNRPPRTWTIAGTETWNGGRCLRLQAVQQSENWERPAPGQPSWQRSEVLLIPPADGFAGVLHRAVERREGRDLVGRLYVKLERLTSQRHVGDRFVEVRSEIELAWWLEQDLNALEKSPARGQPAEYKKRLVRLEQYLAEARGKSSFRPMLEATRRRCEAGGLGQAPPVVLVQAVPPEKPADGLRLEKPAPDFVVADVEKPTGRMRLSSLRGKPAVIVFFKPDSVTSQGSLQITAALHKHYGQQIGLLPLACVTGNDAAAGQRSRLQFAPAIYEGDEVAKQFGTRSYPRFVVLDSAGIFRWEFEGCGPETGFLIKQEVDKLLAEDGKRPRR